MLFEDLDTLNEMIDLVRSGADNRQHINMSHVKDINKTKSARRFRDLNDPEIDRLYSTSPPESEQVGTFELDNALLSEFHSDGVHDAQESKKSVTSSPVITKSKSQISADIQLEYTDPQRVFRKADVATSKVATSGLSLLLSDNGDGNNKAGRSYSLMGLSSGEMSLTIYLPNRKPLEVAVDPSGTVDVAIKSILLADEASSTPTTSLHHHAPECYDLRLHEGDGEPDEDFPALDRKRILKQFGDVSEYCLCRKKGVVVPPMPSRDEQANSKSAHSDSSLPADTILVLLPNSGHTKLRLDPTTTAQDLITLVSKTHRLKLYTADYICCLTDEDQRRLQCFSPILDPAATILNLNIKKIELQQRVYADSSRLKAVKRRSKGEDGGHDSMSLTKLDSSMLFTDITAAVYQEWNVVKKNKFGRMQERVLGVDGSHMYNSKRLGGGSKSGVAHAVRDISTVVQVHSVVGDPCSLRVTFDDDREIYDIGYTCDSQRECFELMAKLKYLLAARNKIE